MFFYESFKIGEFFGINFIAPNYPSESFSSSKRRRIDGGATPSLLIKA